ncbi:serine O-acetyltransferase [Caldicoprobacter guelmensis]|nr:serine O-acetyltransferase [Caldicoprobacter guelmensis]
MPRYGERGGVLLDSSIPNQSGTAEAFVSESRDEGFYFTEGGRHMFDRIRKDIQAVLERDPAARNALEVILCYPGFHAILLHRIAHWFYGKGFKLIARLISQFNRFITGIEIHPAAKIGEGLFIDHGMGVVIGETAEIGNNVTIYQGATLGGTGKETGKRHPTIGNNVVISAGAKVLGPFKVGDNSKIGANAVVLSEVPPNCTVVGVPGKIVKKDNKRVASARDEIDLDQVRLPDPVAEQIKEILDRISMLEKKVQELEGRYKNEVV